MSLWLQRRVIACLAFLLGAGQGAATGVPPSQSDRKASPSRPNLPSPALDALFAEADRALRSGPFSVMDKELVPPSGDKHDYMSIGPYWWPDPQQPNGLPYMRRDGERNPE